ncbi:MAG: carboxylesterase/lipase family protein [Lewinella sp.]
MRRIMYSLMVLATLVGCSRPEIVATQQGKIKGLISSDQVVRVFRGIPFAAPPTGDLRWRAPQPVTNWQGVKECLEFSASPIQNKPEPFLCWTEEFIAQPEPLSEDCLYLNVWTTAKAKAEKQPVFVWIYGGGFTSGSANCDIYDGEEMARQGVVFVSINYRVGVMGFMAHPELSKEAEYGTSGNYGLLDQVAALKWVRENIAAFGGDPEQVTIAGQSAGSYSVNALITSPLAEGLFARAILQSGGILSGRPIEDLTEAENMGLDFMEKVGATSLSDLRAMPAITLQQEKSVPFSIALDGHLLPKDVVGHYKNKRQHQVPILAGWVTGDGTLFGPANTTAEDFRATTIDRYGERADKFLTTFPFATDEEATAINLRMSMLSFAGVPAHRLAKYNSAPSYLYEFNHVPPEKEDFPDYGAFHTADVPYALHTLHAWKRNWEEEDRSLEKVMSSYWVNFAKTGNPNGADLPEWKLYEAADGFIQELGDEVVSRPGLHRAAFDFLEEM